MFQCNSLSLLTFTYYLKLTLAFLMTIIPFILGERIFIHVIKQKQQNSKLDKSFLKKEGKSLFYILTIFILAFSIHTVLNKENNVCYKYAKKEIVKEYRAIYYSLQNEDLSEDSKTNYLENVLVTAYNNTQTTDNKTNTTDQETQNKVVQVKNETKEEEDNFLKETDLKKLNHIYVQDGSFYLPQYIYGNRTTYSGMNCPTDPLNQGYNNKYGYNNYFYIRLTKFIEDAKKNGYKITFSTQGCRTYQTQVYYYNTMTRGRAANPGYSLHGFGIASDLEFYNSDGSVCPYGRTDSSCSSMGWAHQNAYKYGLTFPLLNASYKEDWHIEPITKIRY